MQGNWETTKVSGPDFSNAIVNEATTVRQLQIKIIRSDRVTMQVHPKLITYLIIEYTNLSP